MERASLLLLLFFWRFHHGHGAPEPLEAVAASAVENGEGGTRAVLADAKEAPVDVELLRFVTPYASGLEVALDVSPYAPLLRSALGASSAAASAGSVASEVGVDFYAAIDTWVGNASGSSVVYVDNTSGECIPVRTRSNGNGWALSAELVLWPPEYPQGAYGLGSTPGDAVDIVPRATVAVLPGWPSAGADVRIGRIRVVEGRLTDAGQRVRFDVDDSGLPGEFARSDDAKIYACEGRRAALHGAALAGFVRRQAAKAAAIADEEERADLLADLARMARSAALLPLLLPATFAQPSGSPAKESIQSGEIVNITYDGGQSQLEKGMPVYFDPSDVFTDQEIDDDWMNSSFPLKPIGHVLRASAGTAAVRFTASFRPSCLRRRGRSSPLPPGQPRLLVPKRPGEVEQVLALLRRARQLGSEEAAARAPAGPESDEDQSSVSGRSLDFELPPLLALANASDGGDKESALTAAGLRALQPLGSINLLKAASPSASARLRRPGDGERRTWPLVRSDDSGERSGGDGGRVCALLPQTSGQLFERRFVLPKLQPGERVLLHLVVTGHGWQETTEQCGEFCHAVYQVSLNGVIVANVTEFRDDCNKNPAGPPQRGTWRFARNGWCPGSVAPGFVLDTTNAGLLREDGGENVVALALQVWSEAKKSYVPYLDVRGFLLQDSASLTVSMSFSVYSAAAVRTARAALHRPPSGGQRHRSPTLAEIALQRGSSDPAALQPFSPEALDRLRARRKRNLRAKSTRPEDALADDVDILDETQSPWYLVNGSFPASGARDTRELASGSTSVGAVRVPLFVGALIQVSTRVVRSTISPVAFPQHWGRMTLHMRLAKPPGDLTFDAWDRLGSLGLSLSSSNRGGQPAARPPERGLLDGSSAAGEAALAALGAAVLVFAVAAVTALSAPEPRRAAFWRSGSRAPELPPIQAGRIVSLELAAPRREASCDATPVE
eukprot:TRINITY_DN6504_c0_g1_i1.p1 TRINITY_DN6504_c0_g1~~TRINITY_DN6504_c0_g1_i1.p1  ORF type:complete len:955 (+),score=214.31 TRINITY_DN6504_c0_g1_i1:117-2981(+)